MRTMRTPGVGWLYDRYGNRWQQSGLDPQVGASYSGGDNRRDGAGYDAAGDLLAPPPPDPNAGARRFEYDGEHRLLETTDAGALIEYVYDAGGRRVRSTLPGAAGETTWHQLYDLAGRPLAAVDDQGHWLRSEVWANGRLLATLTPDGVSYAHLDGQGSVRARSRADGSLAQTCTALPFGDNLLCSGSSASPLHFTGKPRDAETGLDFFGARYYASSLGRFVSPDWAAQAEPVPYAKLDNPQSLNLYAYVLNNPVTRVDPDGHNTLRIPGWCGGEPCNDADPMPTLVSWLRSSRLLSDSHLPCICSQPKSQPRSWSPGDPLPPDPSGLGPDWRRDPSHRSPNDERFVNGSGDKLDWHKGVPGKPGEMGKDNWHWLPEGSKTRDSKRHYHPGDTVANTAAGAVVGVGIGHAVQTIIDTAPVWGPAILAF